MRLVFLCTFMAILPVIPMQKLNISVLHQHPLEQKISARGLCPFCHAQKTCACDTNAWLMKERMLVFRRYVSIPASLLVIYACTQEVTVRSHTACYT